jgi:hypothetical protein
MGPAHRAVYFVIGVAAIAFSMGAASPGRFERLAIATLGLVTIASSLSGY